MAQRMLDMLDMNATETAALTYVAAQVRKSDKRWAEFSKVERLTKRAGSLEIAPEARAAVYPLCFLVQTGRLTSAQEDALLAMPARKFAARAIAIATAEGTVNDSAAAWLAA